MERGGGSAQLRQEISQYLLARQAQAWLRQVWPYRGYTPYMYIISPKHASNFSFSNPFFSQDFVIFVYFITTVRSNTESETVRQSLQFSKLDGIQAEIERYLKKTMFLLSAKMFEIFCPCRNNLQKVLICLQNIINGVSKNAEFMLIQNLLIQVIKNVPKNCFFFCPHTNFI